MASTAVPSDFQPRRGKARLRLGIPAHLLTVHGRCTVTLLDLSESGARVAYEGEHISDGVLEWLGYQAFGAVVRSSGEQVGLRFDDPIAQDWVLETRELLPVIAQGEDRLRSFAREWVRGHPKTYAAWAGARRGGSRPYRQAANDDGIGPVEALDARTWLRAGRPFLVGGAVIGFVAGYISIFF